MYTLNINWKGKRTVGKGDKGINVEKYNRFKKLNYKKEKKMEEERKKKKKKENSTEFQKPKVEAEVYNNNKKCN